MLKALCDARLDREDLRSLMDETAIPPRERKKPKEESQPVAARGRRAAPPLPPPPPDMRKQAFGVDSSGCTYWLFNMQVGGWWLGGPVGRVHGLPAPHGTLR